MSSIVPPCRLRAAVLTRFTRGLILAALASMALGTGLYGCAGPRDAADRGRTGDRSRLGAAAADPASDADVTDAPELTPPPVATVIDARPVAIADGRQVTWGDLRPILNEAAGATALEEHLIDRALEAEAADQGIRLTAEDMARERRLLIESLHPDPDRALLLLEALRNRQGLGRYRFDALVRRNAILRQLVADQVQVGEAEARLLFDLHYGPKRQPRIIVTPDLSTAQVARQRVQSHIDRGLVPESAFATVAAEFSTDTSAARGGLLEPISRSDPSYPVAIRQTLFELSPGAISSPVLVDEQYVLLQLVREAPADSEVELDDVREEMLRLARLQQERRLMDRLIESLLAEMSIVIFDESLHERWRVRQQR